MDGEMDRRQFIETMTGGAESREQQPRYEGRQKFTGVHNVRKISGDLVYIGASDSRQALFENIYPIPRGVSYNAYLLLDEKTVLFDTVDRSVSGQFFENLVYALDGRPLDYLIINHMEPDHCASIAEVLTRWPAAQLICSKAAEPMIRQFFAFELSDHGHTVLEGDQLSAGRHTLAFVMAPMVHWPEAMMTYDTTDKVLFSADAFGTFGALNGNLFADELNFQSEWLADARRYYTNIVGKYGPQVQSVLAKASAIEIRTICPLHGPVWRKDLGWFIDKYLKWSSCTPEEQAVMIVYGSIYGGTENAAKVLASRLSVGGIHNVAVYDVSKTPVSELIAEAFRCSHLVFACATYNMDIFTPMKNLLADLIAHNLQHRRFALIENGSWAPVSGKKMHEALARMQSMEQMGSTVTIRSTPNEESFRQLGELGDAILAAFGKAAPTAAAE
jgi:flavorubredoxin